MDVGTVEGAGREVVPERRCRFPQRRWASTSSSASSQLAITGVADAQDGDRISGMARDWGLDAEPMRSGWPGRAMLAHELPDVVKARDEGWFLVSDAPMWAFLPAVWPAEHRRWLPDRSTRWTRMSCSGAPSTDVPWSAWDYIEHERDINELLTASSVPPRPAGRLWLLRTPKAFRDLDSTIDSLAERAVRAEIALSCDQDFVEFVETTIEDWFEIRQG